MRINTDKYLNNLEVLLDNADYLLDSRPPEGYSMEEFQNSFLSSIKLSKLEDAQSKSSEAILDLMKLLLAQAKSSAANNISSVEIIDDMLYHDYSTYQKVLEILNIS